MTTIPSTGTPQVFYLSQLIGAAIVDADGHRLGMLGDVAVDLRETLPRVTGIWMRGDRSRVALIPRDAIAEFHLNAVWLKVARRFLQPRPLQPDEMLLGEVLDSQVVDTDGLKVVRVNDLQLMRTDGDLRLLAADIGTTGLLRRLSLESPVQRLVGIFGRRLPDRVIPWRMVAAFGGQMTPVKLSISRERLREIHPADLGQLMEDLDRDERVEVMTALEHEAAADALAEAEPEVQSDVVKSLPSELAADILEEMSPDDATDVLTDLPAEKAQELIGLMEAEEANDVRELLQYPEGTAGSVMTTEFIAFAETLTVDETIQRLRGTAPEAEHIYYLYVVDAQQRLVGVLPLRNLLTSPPSQRIGDIMASGVVYLSVTDSVETAVSALTKYDLLAMPVLDESLRLAGVVTVDDVMDVILQKGRRRVPPRFRRRAKPHAGRSRGEA
jgi:magnesium transporter